MTDPGEQACKRRDGDATDPRGQVRPATEDARLGHRRVPDQDQLRPFFLQS